ncbi:GNAT family protein [Plantactinospora mayteni]|uniref:GNAT family N-acetyltransferase n=1 Tax=Plantactinospora mayteni TaxID=566021 RepID=A0ABQ4F2W8_9ACTN|nr:GNAT family N-acetyltransferase [Plantactinospora mayteni]GIH01195.1 GNAT family N-acetyltransferase [Plantactinospora mayteni]
MGDDQPGHELLTTRLALRRPTPADIDTIYRIHHDPAACAHNPADMLATHADAEDRYHRWDQHWQQHDFGYWVIHPREANAQHGILGFSGLKLMRLQDREVLNLFYRLDPVTWGNGIATEAATAVVSWATTDRPDHPVIARVRPDNVASATVAERTGLRRAAHLDTAGEDGLDWIFAKNWEPRRMQSSDSPIRARD